MRLLLDTHALLWCLEDPDRLGQTALEAVMSPSNEVYVSVVSGWEIAIKVGLRKLPAPPDVAGWLPPALEAARFTILPISLADALRVETLPMHHKDPFDRLLIAQAQAEGLMIVTGDAAFAPYNVPLIRC